MSVFKQDRFNAPREGGYYEKELEVNNLKSFIENLLNNIAVSGGDIPKADLETLKNMISGISEYHIKKSWVSNIAGEILENVVTPLVRKADSQNSVKSKKAVKSAWRKILNELGGFAAVGGQGR